MADAKAWPALVIRAGAVLSPPDEELLAGLLDDFAPTAIQDLNDLPLPPGGLWDPTFPPIPDPPPAALAWRVFFATAAERDNALLALRAARGDLELSAEEVSDEDWAARSQRNLTAIRVGRFVVAPPWADAEHGGVSFGDRGGDHGEAGRRDREAIVIVIEPSRGFGTGHHASTRLCLRALSEIDVAGKRVLDLGTGSGVLAMAASLAGALQVTAVDVDDDAIESARHSAELNASLAEITWLVGDFREAAWAPLAGSRWDVVLANLTGAMLVSSAARLRELLAPSGWLICSGFDVNEAADVERALDLRVDARLEEDGWVGLVLAPRDRDA